MALRIGQQIQATEALGARTLATPHAHGKRRHLWHFLRLMRLLFLLHPRCRSRCCPTTCTRATTLRTACSSAGHRPRCPLTRERRWTRLQRTPTKHFPSPSGGECACQTGPLRGPPLPGVGSASWASFTRSRWARCRWRTASPRPSGRCPTRWASPADRVSSRPRTRGVSTGCSASFATFRAIIAWTLPIAPDGGRRLAAVVVRCSETAR
mmetsp:Transcript_31648/g.75927  ORF Transcript_31648/g.75927 Transcript_31648/m.75927 type:complete len:210 (+) Transcript_31648:302-931(+)